MVLVDTSVWIQHFREKQPALESLLEQAEVLTHQFIIGELACGNLKHRRETLFYLDALPKATVATHEETMRLIERYGLSGRGMSWIDAHLVASALLTNCRLWTLDKRLQDAVLAANAVIY
jgi:predicted nucleic acid-binding protein